MVYFEVWAKDVDDPRVVLQAKIPAPDNEVEAEMYANQMADVLRQRGATEVSVKRVEE